MPRSDGMIQICSRWQVSVGLALNSAWVMPRARAHALDFAGANDAATAAGILVGDGPVQDVGDDFHVAVGMGRKARAALDPVFS